MNRTIPNNIFEALFPETGILSDQEIDSIKTNSQVVTHTKKDVLFKQDNFTSHIIFLKSGLVKLTKEIRNNKSLILKISTPGQFIGILSQFGSHAYEYTATAIKDCEVYYIDVNIFNSILENNGKYAMYIINIVCDENIGIFNRIIMQNQKQLPGKLADIVLYFSEEIYHSDSFEFPLTRTELAELAGTTKESFIRTLTEFKNDKIIKIENKLIEITSFEILKTLSRIG
jgi:CRP/FNR family transcriptional regulator